MRMHVNMRVHMLAHRGRTQRVRVRRPSCGGRMRAPPRVNAWKKRACVTRPIHVCPHETRMQRGAIASRATVAFHAIIVTRDHGPEGGGNGFNCGIEISRWTRLIYAGSGSRAQLWYSQLASQKSKVVAQFPSSSSSLLFRFVSN